MRDLTRYEEPVRRSLSSDEELEFLHGFEEEVDEEAWDVEAHHLIDCRCRACLEEDPETEELFGGISEKDYLRWAQFSLNMYFKKKGLRGPIIEDGKDTVAFRNAVELFNKKATSRWKNRELDRKTQDALIRENERNSGYLIWLRTQLNKLGYDHLTKAYGVHEKPTAAIKEFQGDYNGQFGLTLVQDGFVGAKTHLAILHANKPLKPKRPVRPPGKPDKTDWDAFLNTKLRQLGEYLDMQRPFDRDTVYYCLLEKFARNGVEDFVAMGVPKLDHYDPPPVSQSLRDLLIHDLKKGYARGKITTFWNRFQIHVDNATTALSAILFRVTGQDIYDRRWKPVVHELKAQSRRINHVYSCAFFRQFIEMM